MNWLRRHWYDLGGFLSLIVFIHLFISHSDLTHYQLVMWMSLIALFMHQLEEYRIVGTFPGMVNTVMYNSTMPDRYPLNTNTAFYVNVVIGWTLYFFAALLAEKAVWLGIVTMMVSIGNITAHTTLFNIKGRTWYNAGLATSWLLFIPCVYFFFTIIHHEHLVTMIDYYIGIPVGIAANIVGILKLIGWMADKNTEYVFENRNLLPVDRKTPQSLTSR